MLNFKKVAEQLETITVTHNKDLNKCLDILDKRLLSPDNSEYLTGVLDFARDTVAGLINLDKAELETLEEQGYLNDIFAFMQEIARTDDCINLKQYSELIDMISDVANELELINSPHLVK